MFQLNSMEYTNCLYKSVFFTFLKGSGYRTGRGSLNLKTYSTRLPLAT